MGETTAHFIVMVDAAVRKSLGAVGVQYLDELRATIAKQTKDYDDCAALLLEEQAELDRVRGGRDHLGCSLDATHVYKHDANCGYPNEAQTRTQLLAEVERLKRHLGEAIDVQVAAAREYEIRVEQLQDRELQTAIDASGADGEFVQRYRDRMDEAEALAENYRQQMSQSESELKQLRKDAG